MAEVGVVTQGTFSTVHKPKSIQSPDLLTCKYLVAYTAIHVPTP